MNRILQNSLQDVRYALRQLRHSPGFTLTAVLTLAFGIGATTAIFSIVEGVLLRPLPFPDSSRLVVVSDVLAGANITSNGEQGVTIPEILAYQRDTRGFSSLGGYSQTSYELSGAGDPSQVNASRLTASVFQVLSVPPLIGRTFTQQEDQGQSAGRGHQLRDMEQPLPPRPRHPGPQDTPRPQALRDHRRHAARF